MAHLSLDKKINGRILVVEDTALVRNFLGEILAQQGHQMTLVGDGVEALHHIENETFDLVISDIHMPGLNGLDLVTKIKSVQPFLPIIIITGYPSLSKAVTAIKQGAKDFLTKPFNIQHVTELVQETLQEKKLLSENQHLLAELNNKAVIEKLNHQLQQKVCQLTKLYTISESFHTQVDNSAMFQRIVELAGELTNSRRVSLMSFDPARRHLVIRAALGIAPEVLQSTRLEMGEGVAGRVARRARLQRVTSKDSGPENANSRYYLSQSWLSVPLFVGDEIFGVLNLTDKSDSSDFTEEDEYLIMMLAEKSGIKIENNALYEGIYTNLLDTLKALVSTIEAKDPYTRYHSQRVTEAALSLARYVHCSEEDCESIAFAGVLHDIGKIGIQDSILLKPGHLNSEEYEIIKRHPVISDSILQPLGLIEAERQIIRHHHERVDGKGYPDGLSGGQITTLSKIVSIADAFDAMISTRAYRKAMPLNEVFKELRAHSHKQFDGDLVEALIMGIETGHILVRGDQGEDPMIIDAQARSHASSAANSIGSFLKKELKSSPIADDTDNVCREC